jgi:hypothetical protein
VAADSSPARSSGLPSKVPANAGFLRRLAALGASRCELVESEDRLDDVMACLHRRISPPVATSLGWRRPVSS